MRPTAPILVLDTPRTFSHLFGKFFDAHPDLDYYYRPYFQVALNTSQELADGIKTNFPTECANGNESLATPGVEVRRELVDHATANLVAEALDVGIHPGMLVQARQHAHMPVRPPEQISVWPLT